jgi:hypothetical protein
MSPTAVATLGVVLGVLLYVHAHATKRTEHERPSYRGHRG